MGVRLQGGYKKGNDEYDVYVYDSAYALAPIEIKIGGDGFRIDYTPSENERFAPIFTSVCSFNFAFEDNIFLNIFLLSLIASNEGQMVLQINKNGSRWWVGPLLIDDIEHEDRATPFLFRVSASDGLAKLKDVDYNNSGSAYTGTATLAAHIFNCLNKIGVTSHHSTGDFIIDNTHWVEDNMQVHTVATGDITRLLDYTRLDHRVFKKQDRKGKITYNSCFEVLEKIMKALGCRLMYAGGSFRVDQYNKLVEDDIFYYTYDNTGTIDATPVRDTAFVKTVDTDITRVISSGGTLSFLPAFKDAVIYYDHFGTRNLIEGETWNGAGGARTFDEFDTNGGTSKILSGWQVQYSVDFGADTWNFVLWRVRIKVGSYYLRRTATVGANGLVTYGNTTWTTSNSYYYDAGDFTTFNNLVQTHPINFETPVPTTSGTLEVNFEADSVYDIDGNIVSSLSYTIDFNAIGYIEALINGVIKDQSDSRNYLSINSTSGNTRRYERTVNIGDGPTGNSFGHLEIYNGSSWENSDAWRVGDSGTYTQMGALLANEIMRPNSFPVIKMNASFTGDYEAYLPIDRGSNIYLPLRVSFTAKDSIWAGEWHLVNLQINYSEQTPEDTIVRTRPLPPSILTAPIGTPEIRTSVPGKDEILNKLIPAQVGSAGISSGATVTSIPLKSAATGDDFIKDDIVVLVNLNTGESQEFTVTTNVVATDTTISVSSVTATADFPADSFIIQKAQQAKEQLNTSLAKRLPLEDYQVDANYTNKLTITNMDEFSIQVRDDATSPTAVTTLTMNMSSTVLVYQKGGNSIYLDLDDVTGARMYYDNGSSVTTVQVKDGIINLEGVPNYADNTAADAALSSGDIYTLTGDRTLYKKP